MSKRTIIGEDGREYEITEKKPIFKKWWFWVIVVLFIGAYGNSTKDKEEKAVNKSENIETEKEVPTNKSEDTKPKENVAKINKDDTVNIEKETVVNEEDLDLTDAEIDAMMMELLKASLDNSYEGIANVNYLEEHNAFTLSLIGETAEAVSMVTLYYDEPVYKESWQYMVDGFVELSKSVKDNYKSGFSFHILNPLNEDNVLLSVTDGVVFYNIADEL